jgi:uncharacterized membrane protein
MIPFGNGDPNWIVAGWFLAAFGFFLAGLCLRRQAFRDLPWWPLLIASITLVVLWQIRAITLPGLSLHLMGAMLCTLVFGPVLALLPLTVALTSVTLTSGADWSTLGLNACLLVFWPVLIASALARLIGRLPSNIFVFIFLGGFFSSAIVVLLTGWLVTAVLWVMQFYPWEGMLEDFTFYWLLVAFSEAWTSGMLLTVLVVYSPERVALFDAARYIDRA